MLNIVPYFQINAIKEGVKGISVLEREITKYVNDGKDEYKEVMCAYSIHPRFFAYLKLFSNFINYCVSLQQKESELQETNSQLHEAEKNKEKVNKEMGNIRQDIDTQKVRLRLSLLSHLYFFYL